MSSGKYTLWKIWVVLCWMASTSTRWGGYFLDPFLSVKRKMLEGNLCNIGDACLCAVRVTARLSAVSACSLARLDDVSWTAGTFGHEEAACYWEGKAQCRARAAPSPSPHCIWTHRTSNADNIKADLVIYRLTRGQTVIDLSATLTVFTVMGLIH